MVSFLQVRLYCFVGAVRLYSGAESRKVVLRSRKQNWGPGVGILSSDFPGAHASLVTAIAQMALKSPQGHSQSLSSVCQGLATLQCVATFLSEIIVSGSPGSTYDGIMGRMRLYMVTLPFCCSFWSPDVTADQPQAQLPAPRMPPNLGSQDLSRP